MGPMGSIQRKKEHKKIRKDKIKTFLFLTDQTVCSQ